MTNKDFDYRDAIKALNCEMSEILPALHHRIAEEIATWYREDDGIKSPLGYTFEDLNKFSNCGADYEELQYALLGAGMEVDRLLEEIERLRGNVDRTDDSPNSTSA
ncbi:hypothetical protein [Aquamicrobium sp.]|uniref:hypothetical protein n=1 Tax=Aquamicrobium sp. TaxID=1872579 RepID=UPI002585577B|nr:hypothetical protein [Aquamicrobium sp.]MCK9549197.1 hypothetical protein [Aquamicrobium sp.]